MILIASHIAGHTTPHFARRMGESIPDRFTFAVLIPCTFHLVRGSGGTPEKSFRKARFLDDRFRYRTWDGARNLVGNWFFSSFCDHLDAPCKKRLRFARIGQTESSF